MNYNVITNKRKSHEFFLLVECAHLRSSAFLKPTPYVEITVDDQNPRKTETVKTTIQPKWNETFTLLVTPHSKINFSVMDHNSFRKDTIIGEKIMELFQLLSHFNGRCDNLDLTLDLMNENKQTESPIKVGELMCTLKGLNIDMSNYVRSNGSMPLAQSNTDVPNRTVLNGIRAKLRSQGTENVVPTSSRNSTERQTVAMPALALSPSSDNVPNGKFKKFNLKL
ncbi:hypothetical protein NQ314_009807 [Rhamnusium bicolor]|uniref:C2 domain-containing protein n=1 Tax=Rhamnusium bicolor TaxID=1586634 RepID=A0AAV8XXT7_9CUCU|nr:hypothetical protein NQ314_009807 [Rhamnusium bicolor]